MNRGRLLRLRGLAIMSRGPGQSQRHGNRTDCGSRHFVLTGQEPMWPRRHEIATQDSLLDLDPSTVRLPRGHFAPHEPASGLLDRNAVLTIIVNDGLDRHAEHVFEIVGRGSRPRPSCPGAGRPAHDRSGPLPCRF